MKLLVTGGAGFIGANFIHYWLEKYEDQIVNLDALTYAGNLENLKTIENDPRYSFVEGDICDAALVGRLVSDVDIVVHFAAESHVDRSIAEPDAFITTNVLGTHTILKAVERHKKRLHHVSTDEVYGSLELDSDERFTEKSCYDPHSPYSASKAASDHLVRAYFDTFGTQVTISNCSNNYGPFQNVEKLIPLFITNLMADKKVPVYGDGLNVRDWLYVTDHVIAIDLIIKRGKIGETYLIGGDSEKNNMQVTRTILELMGKDETFIEYVEDRKGHDRRYAIDFSKIRNELGWQPSVSFEEGLKKTIEWYKGH
jgi:dTDP-glucose 4,6-dehydratase